MIEGKILLEVEYETKIKPSEPLGSLIELKQSITDFISLLWNIWFCVLMLRRVKAIRALSSTIFSYRNIARKDFFKALEESCGLDKQFLIYTGKRGTFTKEKVAASLENLRSKASTEGNLMPYIIECVRAYTTVGEITSVFKEVFGKFE